MLAPIVAGILWLGVFPNPQLRRIERQALVITTQQDALLT